MTTGPAQGRFETDFLGPSRRRIRRGVPEPRGIALAQWALYGRTKRSRAAATGRGGMQAGGEWRVGKPTGGRQSSRLAESPSGPSGGVAALSDRERGRGRPANVAQGALRDGRARA